MKRIRSSRRFGMPLALLLGATAAWTTLAPMSAQAWESTWTSEDGSITLWYEVGSDGETHFAVTIEKNNKLTVSFSQAVVSAVFDKITGGGDPGPDDDSRTQSEPVKVPALIKAGLITYKIKVTPENSKLATWIEQDGGGVVPVWNPNDSDNKSPGNPLRNNANSGPTARQLAALAKLVNIAAAELTQIGTSMGDVGDLGGESAPGLPTNKSGNGNKNNGAANGTDNKKGGRKILGSDLSLGARPDLVNPPHSNSKGARLFAPGLLETGGGLSSSNGPSAIGAPLGGIGSRANIR